MTLMVGTIIEMSVSVKGQPSNPLAIKWSEDISVCLMHAGFHSNQILQLVMSHIQIETFNSTGLG